LANTNAEEAHSSGQSSGSDISLIFRSIAGVFRRRLWTFISIAAILFLAIAAGTMLLRPEYKAVARLKIDPARNAATGLQADRPVGNGDTTAIDTEVAVMTSRDLLASVVRDMKLYSNPVMTSGLPAYSGETGAPLDERVKAIAARLESMLNAEREPNTYVVNVSVRSPDAGLAAAIANSVVDHYLNSSVGTRTGTASQQSKMLEQRLVALGSDVRSIDAQIAQRKAAAGLVQGGTNGTITDQQVAPIATQLATAEAAAAASRSALAAAQTQIRAGHLENIAGVLTSPVVADLRRQRAQVLNNMGEVQARYGPKHPETIRVQQQLDAIDGQIREEAQRITDSLRSDAAAADAKAANLRGNLTQLRAEQAGNTRASAAVESLEREAQTKRDAYNRLAESVQQASQIARNDLPQAQIIEAATAPSRPSFPNTKLLLGAGFVLSLILAGAAITVQEVLAPGLRTAGEIEQRYGLPLLAAVPKLRPSELKALTSPRRPADILIERQASFYAEAFRTIRNALLLSPAPGREPPKIIAVVSTLPGEGKTTCAISLARVLALAGERVLLFDGDLRRAGARDYVEQTRTRGLGEVLTGEAHVDEAIAHDVVSGLDILTVAKPLFTSVDLFGGERMRDLLDLLKGRYDRIVIDTPPVLGVADARTLASMADAVTAVVHWNKTPRDAVDSALSALHMDQAAVRGIIFSMVDRSSVAVGAQYYSRKYNSYYSE
jgi:polysaccharide biosynthesis transport protein